MRTKFLALAGVALLFALAVFASATPSSAQTPNTFNQDSAVGINLEWNTFRMPRVAFANAMKTGRKWHQSSIGSACGTGGGAFSGPVDSNGYPTDIGTRECVYSELFEGDYSDGAWPIGEWVLRWSGDATFSVGENASGYTVTGPGRATFDVSTGSGGMRLELRSVPTSVSDVRLYPPGGVCFDGANPIPNKFCSTARCDGGACNDALGCDGAETCVDLETAGEANNVTFHPLWLSRLSQYRTLRFMNWLHTNHSRVEDFSEWLPKSNYTWSYGHDPLGAVPLAVIAELCNTVNADCYVNIPSRATDAHITEFVEFFRDNVNENLKVFLEYSNEVWNPGFEQHDFSSQQGYELWQSDPNAFDGSDCESVVGFGPSEADCANNWHGKRTYEMCALAQAAFDAAGQSDRLVCVSGRRVAPSGSELGTTLDCARWTDAPNGNCYSGSDIDVVAVNMYFGRGSEDCGSTQQAACDAAMEDVARRLCDGSGCPITELSAALASRGLSWSLMVYEGGSHLDDPASQACADLAVLPNTCMADLYEAALDDWRDLDQIDGYNLQSYVFFDNSGRLGHNVTSGNLFGHRGSNEGEWPKETAILDWDDTLGNECWWPDCEIQPVPEPGRWVLLLSAMPVVILLAWLRRRRLEAH